MNGIKKTFIFSVISLVVALSMTACKSEQNGDGNSGGGDNASVYEVSVDAKNVSVEVSDIKVCIYALDGSEGSLEAALTNGKATFALSAGNYVATLSGLSETVSFSSVLLTETNKKANITLRNSDYDADADAYKFTYSVMMFPGEKKLDELSIQLCDDNMCMLEYFGNSNVMDVSVHCGEYSVEIYDSDFKEIYNDNCSVTPDTRFYLIQL